MMAFHGRPDALYGRPDPTLEDLLSDEVTQAVMRADHVAVPDVRRLCRAVGVLLDERAGQPRAR